MDGVRTHTLAITPATLKLIPEIDEFKGAWTALGRISPERLTALKRVATIESIGSSTRIEGARLSDKEVEQLLSGLEIMACAHDAAAARRVRLCAVQLPGQRRRAQQGRVLPFAAPDPGDDPERRPGVAALAGILSPCAAAPESTA